MLDVGCEQFDMKSELAMLNMMEEFKVDLLSFTSHLSILHFPTAAGKLWIQH